MRSARAPCGAACVLAVSGLALLAMNGSRAADAVVNAAPKPQDWADLAKLPDWSGVWTPNTADQERRETADPIPWNRQAAAQIAKLQARENGGNPKGLFIDCLPEGMPSWMLITHNAMEFLFTPGRVSILGEMDGNRLRRIYTDGRPHPADPDPSFHGHSIGHWEGGTLVVDTVGILPEVYIAPSESVGLPNNGDMHIVEHIHLVGPDKLEDDLEISAPHVLTRTWRTSRLMFRQRARKYDIVEGVCIQGNYSEAQDASGNAVFVPVPQTGDGNMLPPAK